MSRRPGVTAFVGLARAGRVSVSAALPAFALVLALAVIAFGAMLRAAVLRGDVATSWRSLGADVVIDASHANAYLGTPAQRAVAALPGVRGTTVMSNLTGIAPDGTQVAIVAVDPASYSALIKLTPLPAFPASALARPPGTGTGGTRSVPVLASPSAASAIGTTGTVLVGSRTLSVRVSKVVSGAPGSGASGQFIVAPYWALPDAQALPDRMLVVGPGVPDARLRALISRMQPGSAVTFRSHQVQSLTNAPLPHLAAVTFVESALAAAGFGVVIIAIMLALGARPRQLTLARLFTMGLSARQARRLVVTEALPSILAAAAGGAAAALALVPLIGPSIDLSPLTGSSGPVTVRTDLGVVGYVVGGLLLLAMAALVAQSAAARRQGGDHLMRIGE